MGLFSFIKSAGAKVFGSGEASEEEKAVAATAAAANLKTAIEAMGLEVSGLDITIDGDTATVYGEAVTQEVKEKVVLVVGNTEGLASVDDRMTVAEVEVVVPEAQFHTVGKGDTLGKIAKQYYGNAMQYPTIFEANKPMLEHPDKIYPGQVLRIPNIEG